MASFFTIQQLTFTKNDEGLLISILLSAGEKLPSFGNEDKNFVFCFAFRQLNSIFAA